MELSWKELAKVYAPVLALVLLNVVGGIYVFGFERGKRAMLDAAQASAREAVHG